MVGTDILAIYLGQNLHGKAGCKRFLKTTFQLFQVNIDGTGKKGGQIRHLNNIIIIIIIII